jgi:hypothetical protein
MILSNFQNRLRIRTWKRYSTLEKKSLGLDQPHDMTSLDYYSIEGLRRLLTINCAT